MGSRCKVADMDLTHRSHSLDVLVVGFEVWRNDSESDHYSEVNSSSSTL